MKHSRYARLIPILAAAVLGVAGALVFASLIDGPPPVDPPESRPPAAKPSPQHAEPAAPTTYLMSIQGIPLRINDYVNAFSLKFSGAKVVKVCRTPAGWSVDPASDGTGLQGQATVGAAFLDRQHIDDLHGLALIETDAGDASTVGISGSAQAGVYGDMGEAREARLDHARVALIPASGCPG